MLKEILLFLVLLAVPSTNSVLIQKICGSDRKIYANICDFVAKTCATNIYQVEAKACKDRWYRYTYRRRKQRGCVLDKKTRKTRHFLMCDITNRICRNTFNRRYLLLHTGDCGDCGQSNVCPWLSKSKEIKKIIEKENKAIEKIKKTKKDKKIKKKSIVICGSDGVKYATQCQYRMARCSKYNHDKGYYKYFRYEADLLVARKKIYSNEKCPRTQRTLHVRKWFG